MPLLDIPAVARRLGVSGKTIRRAIDRGDLPAIRLGRLIRIAEDDLERYVIQHRTGGRHRQYNPN
jgi:excisionase family DNA binding protein